MPNQEFITPIDQFVIDFVRTLRVNKKLRHQDIGSIIGVSREYIKDIENKNRRAKYNLRQINALAEYFEMSPRDFLPEKPLKLYSKPTLSQTLKAKSKIGRPKPQIIKIKKSLSKKGPKN
jgi:transcriptional regulator with XRE-family HTH domain